MPSGPGAPAAELDRFHARYLQIVDTGYAQNPAPEPLHDPQRRSRRKQSKARNLLDRFRDHPDGILAFMRDFAVPFDNNLPERGNAVVSRNLRLTAIRTFFRFVAPRDPASVGVASRVLAIPMKRADTKVRDYLTAQEIDAILAVFDQKQWLGQRNYALLLTMYNTGARVSEMVTLRQDQVSLGSKGHVRLYGKGRKERIVPLWPKTRRVLQGWFANLPKIGTPVAFPNRTGEQLTRFAVHLLLQEAANQASQGCPSLTKKAVSPHKLRHGTAMALLESGVDLAVIALWLGHESLETTNIYLHSNLAMKEKALGKIAPPETGFRRFQADDSLLAFLDSL